MNNLYYLIPTAIIILMIFPVFVQLRVTFDLQDVSGVLSLYIYKYKVKHFMYQIKGKTIVLKNEAETKQREIAFEDQSFLVVEEFIKQIKAKSRLKELFVFYNIGFGDAFLSAMVGGAINVAVLTYFTSLKNKRPTASMGIYDTVSYNRQLFEMAAKGSVSVSLFDIAYSLILSVILSKKAAKARKGEQA